MRITLPCLLSLAQAGTSQSRNAGMEMVIDVLKKMHAETGVEQEAEQKMFEELRVQNVADVAEAEEEIKHLTQRVEEKSAEQAENESEAQKLAGEIATLGDELAVLGTSHKKMQIKRRAENKIYYEEEAELASTVNQLGQAIQVLKDSSVTLKPSFVEEMSRIVPAARSLLQEAMLQPQASQTVLESTIKPVIDMFKSLHKKLSTQLSDMRNAEANSLNAFNLMEMSKKGEIENNNNSQTRKTELEGNAAAKAGAAEKIKNDSQGELDNWKTILAEKQQFMADNSEMFKNNQALRSKEMTGIAEALEILGGEDTVKALSNVDRVAVKSFLQLASGVEGRRQALLSKVANQLVQINTRSFKNRNSNLALVSMQIMEGGPFDKIIKMISDMIDTLEAQSAAEGAHYKWCNEETDANKTDQEQKQSEVDKLNTRIDELNAEIAEATDAIAEADEIVKTTVESLAARRKLHQEIVDECERIVQENIEGVRALTAALAKLREAGLGLVQLSSSQPEGIAEYKGRDATGPIATLEIIQQDMVELGSNKKAERVEEINAFKVESKTMGEAIALNRETSREQQVLKVNKTGSLGRAKKALGQAEKQLSLSIEYGSKLHAMCNPPVLSYEDKKAKREEEIEALQDALKILSEEV